MDGESSDSSRPSTADLLADLQAGLVDDATAAELRRRARTDPAVARQLAALDRVRRDLAALGSDGGSAPDAPADVVARIGQVLRNASAVPGTVPRT